MSMLKKKKKSSNVVPPELLQQAENTLLLSLRELYATGDFSDFTIKSSDSSYKVHKAIICPRSPFFNAVFKNNMKETETAEVDFSEHNPTAVRLLVHFLYHLDYPVLDADGKAYEKGQSDQEDDFFNFASQRSSSIPNLINHCRVYALADFCQVEGLKTLAVAKFKKEAHEFWDHPEFFESLQIIYGADAPPDEQMRKAVVEVMMRHRTLLDRQEFQDLVKQLDLAYDLLMEGHRSGQWN